MANEVYFTGENPVWGNKRMALGSITMSGLVSGAANVGLGRVVGANVSIRAHTDETSYTVSYNVGSAGTTINGMVRIQSAVAGDIFDIQAWGE